MEYTLVKQGDGAAGVQGLLREEEKALQTF